jgi:RimJ/RimL family protein N-acetyltransferase
VTERELPEEVNISDGVVALRRWTTADIPAITAIWQDEELQRRFAVTPPVTDASSTGYVRGVTGAWGDGVQLSLAIEVDGTVVGGCDVDELDQPTPQLGYWLAVDARGQGLASRAGGLLVEWTAAELGITRLELEVEPDNAASIRVAERLGFSRIEGIERTDGERRLAVYERARSRSRPAGGS